MARVSVDLFFEKVMVRRVVQIEFGRVFVADAADIARAEFAWCFTTACAARCAGGSDGLCALRVLLVFLTFFAALFAFGRRLAR